MESISLKVDVDRVYNRLNDGHLDPGEFLTWWLSLTPEEREEMLAAASVPC